MKSLRSELEHALARGPRITSSRIATIATGNYRAWNTLAGKLRRGLPAYISRRKSGVAPLDWGHAHESQACAQFWLRHPEYEMFDEPWCYWHDPRAKRLWERCGTSPDRTLYQLLERVSGVEAKCPWLRDIHRRYWSERVLPPEYVPQVQWHMAVTDCPDWWFVSFDPRDPSERTGYFELLVQRDPDYEAALLEKVNRFLDGLESGEEFKPVRRGADDYRRLFQ